MKKSPKSSSFLAVYNAIRVIDLLNAPVALHRLDHWFLVALNDLLGEAFRKRRRDFLNLIGWRCRHDRTLFGKRLFDLELSMSLHNLGSQVMAQIRKVPVPVLNHRGIHE